MYRNVQHSRKTRIVPHLYRETEDFFPPSLLRDAHQRSPGDSAIAKSRFRKILELDLGEFMSNSRNYREAEREREARERGRTIPHYAGKVAKALSTRRSKGSSTPSKRAQK